MASIRSEVEDAYKELKSFATMAFVYQGRAETYCIELKNHVIKQCAACLS